jgi:membrane-bound ClpP family serine protease
MDSSTLVWIIGFVVLVEYFHVGHLVSSIRKQTRKQTKLLIASTIPLAGKSGTARTWLMPKVWGIVRVMDEDWDGWSPEEIPQGEALVVRSVDGLSLTVAKASKPAAAPAPPRAA